MIIQINAKHPHQEQITIAIAPNIHKHSKNNNKIIINGIDKIKPIRAKSAHCQPVSSRKRPPKSNSKVSKTIAINPTTRTIATNPRIARPTKHPTPTTTMISNIASIMIPIIPPIIAPIISPTMISNRRMKATTIHKGIATTVAQAGIPVSIRIAASAIKKINAPANPPINPSPIVATILNLF